MISLSLAEIETPPIPVRRRRRSHREIQFEDLVIQRGNVNGARGEFQDSPEVFENAVRWIIDGIEGELRAL